MIRLPSAGEWCGQAAGVAPILLPRDFGYLMCMAGSKSRPRHDFPPEAEAMAMPSDLDARLVEAARIDRYLWAAALCSGQRVLDAGCGLAQGSALLIQSGALEVVAVDSAEAIVEAARAQAPPGVRIEHADILNLPFGSQAFDVVVCFDVIEHSQEPLQVLAALIDVLRDDGMLLLSCSSGAGLVVGTSPIPSEGLVVDVEARLRRRFSSVAIFRQADWGVTAAGEGQAGNEGRSPPPTELRDR